MKHLKRYKSFLEDGTATTTATTAGMGAVSNAQPGALAGTTGTEGSGDVSFYMLDKKGKKIKKGNPSEVSDARYLAPAKGITKVEESYNDIQEYINDIVDKFKVYNIRPVVLNHIIDQCQDQISQYYEEGKDTKSFVDEIVKDMELDSGGFMAHKMGSAGYNRVIKYL